MKQFITALVHKIENYVKVIVNKSLYDILQSFQWLRCVQTTPNKSTKEQWFTLRQTVLGFSLPVV